jgi:heterodisulfide reductase subunit C
VNIADAMNVLRRLAIKHGYVPASIRALVSSILAHGRIYEIDEFVEEERQDLGLPPLPTVDKKFIAKLFEKINSNSPRLVGSD